MSLDMEQVAPQIERMARKLAGGREEHQKHLETALAILHREKNNQDALKQKIEGSATPFMPVAGLIGTPDAAVVPPALPSSFTVFATDGSHIDIDRHRQARCFLLNISTVSLTYGPSPDAALASCPQLYAGEDETILRPPPGVPGHPQPIEGALLGIKRSVAECERLAWLAESLPQGSTALALLDGSLILWGLGSQDYPEFVTEAFLRQGQLHHLDNLRRQAENKKIAVASYISFPRSNDVMNTLRVAICPYEYADCERRCHDLAPGDRPCDAIAGVSDRELFFRFLESGQRSALFASTARLVRKHYGEHQVFFCYLRLEDEIARLEMPQWVAANPERLNLTHSLVLDQVRRGQGYPAALTEAHEQAVIRGADRDNFWWLLDSFFAEEALPTAGSAKDFAKRTRWV